MDKVFEGNDHKEEMRFEEERLATRQLFRTMPTSARVQTVSSGSS